jgi:hypothetical protein
MSLIVLQHCRPHTSNSLFVALAAVIDMVQRSFLSSILTNCFQGTWMVSQGRQSCTSHTGAPSSNIVTCQSLSLRLSSHLHPPGPYGPPQSAIYMVLW